MKYTRNQINRAGDLLISNDADSLKRSEAINIVNEWRETHFFVLSDLNSQISSLLSKAGVQYAFSSQRIKRRQSIIEKLRNNSTNSMKLGGLQDIGGLRYGFADINQLDTAFNLLKDFVPQKFKLEKIYDYVSSPKDSGYRSIHFVYKYDDKTDAVHDGLRIELQIRTTLQHSWAMAVETASLIAKTSLKANLNDNSIWREFFKIVSAVFSYSEKRPLIELYKMYKHEQLCAAYSKIDKDGRLLQQLEALRVATNSDLQNRKIEKNRYCVLLTNFNKRTVSFKFFESEYDQACNVFNTAEQNLMKDEAVVMVSLEKMQELREAYPSYFMDTEEFVKALKSFMDSCKIYE
ncbi:MAG: RelA/SpoT domain-containing protein [Bacteroidales bacterium]|nr:RelA/SpoT domain-containing protein [Bacteroidales bacterium]